MATAKKEIVRDYVVLHEALGSGLNGPLLFKGDSVGPADFDTDFDFDRLLELKAIALKAETPADTRTAQEIADDTQAAVYHIIGINVSPQADQPQGESSFSPVNPSEKAVDEKPVDEKPAETNPAETAENPAEA